MVRVKRHRGSTPEASRFRAPLLGRLLLTGTVVRPAAHRRSALAFQRDCHRLQWSRRHLANTANHRWNGWRGIYVRDPEGNIMEVVSYHEDYDEGRAGTYEFEKLHGGTSGEAFA